MPFVPKGGLGLLSTGMMAVGPGGSQGPEEMEMEEAAPYRPYRMNYNQPTTAQILAGNGSGFSYNTGGIVALSGGGRFLNGPGDGMSDSIPASIQGANSAQPARLADGEFVIPADVVSHIGNGSSDAGSKRLYDMLSRVRKARTGKSKQAPKINAHKYLVS
jgi:hypothetical protein